MTEVQNTIPTELGTEKISKLLKQYALPAIVAMVASSLYNMVDSIFIGHGVGPLAISGLAVTFPFMNLSTAFGTLVGAGAATLLSILLGKQHYKAAGKVLGNVVSLNLIIGLSFMVVALIFLDPILYFFGASENTIPYAREYMKIILYGNVITHIYFGLNNMMRASGDPKKAMGLTIFTVIFNTILDPIFIFTFKMGIAGAAWATVIAQAVAMAIVMAHFSHEKHAIHFKKGILRLDWKVARQSLAIGFGPFLMNAASCVVALFINQQLLKYGGDLAIGGYGICNRITFMFIMICMGLNQGMQPIAGYNFGAKKYSRVREVHKQAAVLATIVVLICWIISVFFPRLAAGIFTHDAEMIDIAAKGLTKMNIVVLIIGYQIVSTNLFQSIGMVRQSIFLSLSRQLLYLVPCVYILPLWMGVDGVWWSFPISDLLASITTIIMMDRLMRKFVKLQDGESAEGIIESEA
ncbi:MAG: MATE family efflux transporter [Candidatus Cryptobacteroides sp.]